MKKKKSQRSEVWGLEGRIIYLPVRMEDGIIWNRAFIVECFGHWEMASGIDEHHRRLGRGEYHSWRRFTITLSRQL